MEDEVKPGIRWAIGWLGALPFVAAGLTFAGPFIAYRASLGLAEAIVTGKGLS